MFSNQEVYVIYMPQREAYIKKVFKDIGIKAIFFPAVIASELPPLTELYSLGILGHDYLKRYLANEHFPDMDLDDFESDPKNTAYINSKLKGVLALQLSYLCIFEKFVNNPKTKPSDHCFIFEDDILYQHPKIWKNRLNNILKELPSDYDIINLGRCFDKCRKNIKYSKNLVSNTFPLCTHACGYSVPIAKHILSHALPMQEACDTLLRKLYLPGKMFKGFSASPAVFFQNKALVGLLGNISFMPECGDGKNTY